MANDNDTHRVTVRVEGAPSPVHTSRWMSLKSAEHAKRNHEAMIRDKGYTHRVAIEERPSFGAWLALVLGRAVTDDDLWGASATVLRAAWDRGEPPSAWKGRI